jgi:hypothetical protein
MFASSSNENFKPHASRNAIESSTLTFTRWFMFLTSNLLLAVATAVIRPSTTCTRIKTLQHQNNTYAYR